MMPRTRIWVLFEGRDTMIEAFDNEEDAVNERDRLNKPRTCRACEGKGQTVNDKDYEAVWLVGPESWGIPEGQPGHDPGGRTIKAGEIIGCWTCGGEGRIRDTAWICGTTLNATAKISPVALAERLLEMHDDGAGVYDLAEEIEKWSAR